MKKNILYNAGLFIISFPYLALTRAVGILLIPMVRILLVAIAIVGIVTMLSFFTSVIIATKPLPLLYILFNISGLVIFLGMRLIRFSITEQWI